MNSLLRGRPGRFFVLLLTVAVSASATHTWAADAGFDRVGPFVERGMELWQVPGMAVAVVTRDTVEFSQGFGTTALVDGKAVDEHTLFAIASTTKAMVVAGLLILADEGKLSLDDPITKYIPELHFATPMQAETIRVRDLLAHRTGLPSTDFWSFLQNMPLDEQIRRLESVPQEAPVRTRLIYQNTMFELAGLVIERLSGQSWDQFLKQRLWKPIGMNETFGARGQITADLSHVMPYRVVDKKVELVDWDLPADLADAAGSVWSSLHDMSLWAQFLLRGAVTTSGERIISADGVAGMFEPQQLASVADFYPTTELTHPHWRSYGLAWFQQDFQGRKIDFHTGSLNGLIALIGLDREGDRAVIILGNRDHAEMRHAVLWEVMDNDPAQPGRDWNQEIFNLYAANAAKAEKKWAEIVASRLKKTHPALALDAYTGTYSNVRTGNLVVQRAGKALELKTAMVTMSLTHWQLDTFLAELNPPDLREFATFRIGTDGTVNAMDIFGEVFTRVTPTE